MQLSDTSKKTIQYETTFREITIICSFFLLKNLNFCDEAIVKAASSFQVTRTVTNALMQ